MASFRREKFLSLGFWLRIPGWGPKMHCKEDLERNQNSSDALDSIMLDLLGSRDRGCQVREIRLNPKP